MAFSYTLFLALILLFPGFCAWAGLRTAERTDLLTPRPDKPNSTSTLFVIVLGTIAGHLGGALVFALQAAWCGTSPYWFRIAFDPNIYRVLFTSGKSAGGVTDLAIFAWLFELALVGIASGAAAGLLAKTVWVKDKWDAIDFGWLNVAATAVKAGDAVIIGYVVTKSSYEGATVAYEGIVQQLALDDDQTITMLVLRNVDRFIVRISETGFERVEVSHDPIAQMQFHLSEIANIALEIIERPASPSEATSASPR